MGCNLRLNEMYCGYNPLTFDPNFQRDIQVANWWFLVRLDHNFAKENHLNQTFTIVFHAQMLNVLPIYLHLGSFGGKRRHLGCSFPGFVSHVTTRTFSSFLGELQLTYLSTYCGVQRWTNPEKVTENPN